jgi:uncharacterized metal-binding protein YceD (DUF177 family)
VDYLKDYIIHFVGLSIGNHLFDFEVNDTFFEQFEYSQLQRGLVKIQVNLDKQDRLMVFTFDIKGTVEVTCDRCGEEFMLPVSGKQNLIVKFGAEFQEESEDMIVIPTTEYKIDLSSFIYEYLHLMLPWRIVHPDDAEGKTRCNPEALRLLEELTPHSTLDPRWDALNAIQQGSVDATSSAPFKKIIKKK